MAVGELGSRAGRCLHVQVTLSAVTVVSMYGRPTVRAFIPRKMEGISGHSHQGAQNSAQAERRIAI